MRTQIDLTPRYLRPLTPSPSWTTTPAPATPLFLPPLPRYPCTNLAPSTSLPLLLRDISALAPFLLRHNIPLFPPPSTEHYLHASLSSFPPFTAMVSTGQSHLVSLPPPLLWRTFTVLTLPPYSPKYYGISAPISPHKPPPCEALSVAGLTAV